MEFLSEILDKLTEVHTAIGNVIEDGLGAVSLKLHIPYLHLQTKVCGKHAGADHCLLLAGNCLLPALDVKGARFTVYFLELLLRRVYALALHLAGNHGALKGNDS